MERIVHKSENFKEAEEWDIHQSINLTPDARRKIAGMLKEKFYGKNPPGIRTTRVFKKIKIK